jgi:putative hydrolase of HD superfamily
MFVRRYAWGQIPFFYQHQGVLMKNIVNLLFQAKILKEIPRSGYHFLGAGQESVAEHSFSTTFIAFVLCHIIPKVDAYKLICMCLVHDLTEARIGDLNTVQKRYVAADENAALEDTTRNLPFGTSIAELVHEFNQGKTVEAKLARDADQIAFILELKALSDIGYVAPQKWLPHVIDRLETTTGRDLSKAIMKTRWDEWWRNNRVDRKNRNH